MIGYVTLGAKDKARAIAFYDAFLAELGIKQVFATDRLHFWGDMANPPMIAVGDPFEGDATHGNGTMLALPVESDAKVDELHAKALALGATDDGAPGLRGGGPFYGGYFRDTENNKLVVYNMSR